jgi:hypothetical protein
MKNKIKEVHDYFKNKIIEGDYIVFKKTSYVWSIEIDKEFKFYLWISNGSSSLECYEHDNNFMNIQLSLKERKLAFKDIEKGIKEHDINVLKVARKIKYESLKKEFES